MGATSPSWQEKKTLSVCVCTSVSTGKLDVCNVLGEKTQTKQSHNHIFRHVRMHVCDHASMKCKCKSQPVLFFAFFAMCTRFCYICYQNCELRVSKSLIPMVILHFLSLRGLKYSEVQCNNLKVYLALIVLTSLINPSLTDSWWENTNMAHSNAPVSELTKLSFPVQTVKQPFTTAWMLHYFFCLIH